MNANAPAFVPQSIAKNGQTTNVSRAQSRSFSPSRTSHQPDTKRLTSKSHGQGDQSARLNAPNRRANHHRKNNNQPRSHQRGHSDDSGDRNRSNDSNTHDSKLAESTGSLAVQEASPASKEPSLDYIDPALYGRRDKKGRISLNHLLNFSLPPRQPAFINVPRRNKVFNYQPYNKDRFVNANFRFLVKSTGDYTVYQVDPDILMNWADIDQVIITGSATPSCPICLQQPIAARVTKCGHTFCLPCIIHYLELADEDVKSYRKWRKCPICWDIVYAKDLKSVRFWTVRNFVKGVRHDNSEMLTMRLIQRSSNSTVALPRSNSWPLRKDTSFNPSPPWHFTPNAFEFTKLMLSSIDYMRSEYNKDAKELESAFEEAKNFGYNEELPFIEMAIVNVKDELENLIGTGINEALEAERRAQEINKIAEPINTAKADETLTTSDDQLVNVGTYHEVELGSASSLSKDAAFTDESNPKLLPDEFRDNARIESQPNMKYYTEVEDERPAIQTTHATSRDVTYYFYQAEDGQHIYLYPLDIRVLKHEFGAFESFPNEITVPILSVEETTWTEDLRKRFKYLGHLPLSCDVSFVEVDLKEIVSKSTLEVFANELRQRQNYRREKAHREERQAARRDDQPAEEIFNSEVSFPPYKATLETSEQHIERNRSIDSDHEASAPGPSAVNNTTTTYNGPRTVWGTPAYVSRVREPEPPEEHDDYEESWGFQEEEIYVGKKQKKKKLVLMSTVGRRRL